MYLQFVFVFFCLLHISLQRSTTQDDHYIAAVVEFAVSRNVEDNQASYIQLIKDAADQSADIVVFPELTLTNSTTSFEVPVNGLLKEYPIPASHPELYDRLLVSMSEAARTNQIYVVINTRELVNCVTNTNNEHCPEAKVYTFNTNVVFDRTGAVINRYRKINLFGEPQHTPALTPDLGVFETDFGVTFGHFICFDLQFQVPAIQLVQKLPITDVIFTTMWFSELPYLTGEYRKINLFGEASHTPALTPDLGVFPTDFGVTFGHFVCFDLMFQVPAIQVVQKMNITDVIFTTMWFSEMPYLTAVQIQEAYAYALNVNFLGSGANNPAVGSAGSGIFSGKAGALISIMPGVSTTRLLVSKVPKVPGQVTEPVPGPIYDPPSDHDGLRLITDPSLVAHVSRPLVPGPQEFTLIDKEVSCSFKVTLNERDGATAPYFRAVVQDGTNTYSKREIGVAACLIVACKDTDFKSCLYRFNPKETKSGIRELQIVMTSYSQKYNSTLSCNNIIYFPVSFTAGKFPLAPTNVTFADNRKVSSNEIEESEDHVSFVQNIVNCGIENEEIEVCDKEDQLSQRHVEKILMSFKINAPQDELQAFGIWGRIYTRDIDHNKHVTSKDIEAFNDILDIIYDASDKNSS